MKTFSFRKKNKEKDREELTKVFESLAEEGVSAEYIQFLTEYRFDFIEQLSYNIPYVKGFFIDLRFIDVVMLYDPRGISQYEVDYGDGEKLLLDLIQIGDNNIPEGGIFISTGQEDRGKIYSYLNEPDRATNDEKVLIGESFMDFIHKIRLYEDFGMEDKGSYTVNKYQEIDIVLNDNRNEFLFPWETTSSNF